MKLLISFLFVWAGTAAFGQPSRVVELFGTVGALRAAADEGSAGSGVAWGGAVTLPFAARWAVDVQALTSQLSDRADFRTRRVLLSPALQYRRGNERAYWFVAFGPGMQRERSTGTYQVFDSVGQSRNVSFDDATSGLTLHWRTGGVFQPARRVLVRGEFFWSNRYVLPDVGVAISLGVRLGR